MISSVCVHRYGDNVDTDTIIPGRYLTLRRPEELAGHCMEGLDPDFVQRVKAGDIIVAGRNFGSGSSRDRIDVDLVAGAFFYGAKRFETPPLPPVIQAIVDAQGLVPYIVNENKRRSTDGSNR